MEGKWVLDNLASPEEAEAVLEMRTNGPCGWRPQNHLLLLALVQLSDMSGPYFHFSPVWPELAWPEGFLERLSSFAGHSPVGGGRSLRVCLCNTRQLACGPCSAVLMFASRVA